MAAWKSSTGRKRLMSMAVKQCPVLRVVRSCMSLRRRVLQARHPLLGGSFPRDHGSPVILMPEFFSL